ncbi:chemotaxis protein MotC [Xanthobacter sp. V4C-4]|uniref:chemotaxis protein MotC n=1 Tax=Xanthobacter cornucopiae TaxID=3119924 RepID=UPI00372BB5E0
MAAPGLDPARPVPPFTAVPMPPPQRPAAPAAANAPISAFAPTRTQLRPDLTAPPVVAPQPIEVAEPALPPPSVPAARPQPAIPAAAPPAPGAPPAGAGERTPADITAAPDPAFAASAIAAPRPAAGNTPDAPRPQAPAPQPAAGGGTLRPVEMVRRLQRLQDRIAAGSADGVSTQRAIIADMDEAFASADPQIWQDPANARALVSYILSGGSPTVLRTIITRDPRPAIDEKLLLGTLLYVEGREDAALRELGEVDARKLPNTLAGQIALAQATLTVRNDPHKASELLDLARLVVPGTLVEEAALRREVLVAAQAGDVPAFERLARHYLYRFNRSAYADSFRQRFANALAHMSLGDTAEGLDRVDGLLGVLDDAGRREMYLLVARAALVEGKTALAARAAERARSLAATASRDAERAQVYLGAAQAVMPDRFQAASQALGKVDRSRLDAADSALVDAALSAADNLRQADQLPPPDRRAPAVAGAPEDSKTSPVMSRARDSLTKIDALLKAAPR